MKGDNSHIWLVEEGLSLPSRGNPSLSFQPAAHRGGWQARILENIQTYKRMRKKHPNILCFREKHPNIQTYAKNPNIQMYETKTYKCLLKTSKPINTREKNIKMHAKTIQTYISNLFCVVWGVPKLIVSKGNKLVSVAWSLHTLIF